MTALTGIELTPDIEGRYYQGKMQWICIHADFKEQVSGREWQLYWWPAIAPTDEGLVMALYQGDRVINLSRFHDPFGTLYFGQTGAEIVYPERTTLSGTYPSYELTLDAPDNMGQTFGLDIHLEAESKGFQAVKDLTGIDWYYIPRLRVTGTLRTHRGTVEVEGTGYLEKRRGRFWAPSTRNGLWESLPTASGMSIPLFYKVWRNDDSPTLQTLCYTADGQTMNDLGQVEVEIMETIRYDERIEHPIKYRVSAEGPDGRATMNVVRNPNRLALRDFWGEPVESRRAVGIYGTGHVEATIEDSTGSHEVSGPSFGSALYFWVEE